MIVRPLALLLPKRARRAARPAMQCARSARLAVLWGVAVVILVHLGLALALETVLPQLRDPEYGYRVVRAREQQRLHPDRPFVLVLGSSRVANAFDPSAAGFPDEPGSPLPFNFGLSGSGSIQLRTHLARIRDDGVRPDVLLVELFPVTLVADGPDDGPYSLVINRLTARDLPRLNLTDPAAFRRRWTTERLNSWYGQRLVIVSHLVPEALSWRERLDHYWKNTDRVGFYPHLAHKADEMRESRLAATRTHYAETARAWRVGAASDRALRGLVADCRAAGTPVAFFLIPESPAFRSWYTPESRAALDAYLRTLSAELSCPVFDAPEGFAEEDFADGHHMLSPGAARFTRHLTERHLKPWLAEVLPRGPITP
jgi:hypothetical protein